MFGFKAKSAAPRHRPRPPRSEVSCSATILADGRFYRANLLDISLGGCRAGVETPMEPGKGVQIALEAFHSLGGKVRWCRNGEIGIQFNRPISQYMLTKWQAQLEQARDQEPLLRPRRSSRNGLETNQNADPDEPSSPATPSSP